VPSVNFPVKNSYFDTLFLAGVATVSRLIVDQRFAVGVDIPVVLIDVLVVAVDIQSQELPVVVECRDNQPWRKHKVVADTTALYYHCLFHP
jgi:hypothetical protein